jgi:hypothetical protein
MDEKKTGFGGFVAAFFVSLMYNLGWLLAAVAALIVCLATGFPIWPMYIGLGIWVLSALTNALIITFGNVNGRWVRLDQDNVNPYSKSNEDFPSNGKR